MNPLIRSFGKKSKWVTWRYATIQGKKTKIPYSLNGVKASSTDPSTWSTYNEIKNHSENIGIVFTADQLLLGIDIDHCIDKDTHAIVHLQKELIANLFIEADTYTEISPSGEGLHLFLKLEEPLTLSGNKKAPFEMYTKGRYFTFTGNPYLEEKDVRTVPKEEALRILAVIGYPWKEAPADIPFNSDHSFDNETILQKMFSSKNGAKVRALYDGDVSFYNGDESSADMALLIHLAFWTQKNAAQMASLWLSSPLGQRKKTQQRKDYRDRSIAAAIESCRETYKEKESIDFLTVTVRKEKHVIQNTENICRLLRSHKNFKERFRYDAFKFTNEIRMTQGNWRIIEDNDAVNIQTEISILFPQIFGKVGKDMVYDAIIKVSKENTMDSALDYMSALVWDKTPRLDTWLSRTYGAPEDEYHRTVGSNWLKGLAKRIVEPGCKFDYVLVLEGPQGSCKSTSLSILGGAWHVETAISTDTKDFFMQFNGNMIVEFSEGETLSRTEVKRMKAIITTQVDKYRPAYGRAILNFPRRCVFAMTTNDEEYLKDETGNRRWLPVKLMKEEADTDWLKENRDQLFAEAYHRVAIDKETVYEFPKEEMQNEQNKRRIHYENSDQIVDWYYNKLSVDDRNNGIQVFQVYRDALNGGYANKPLDKYTEVRIIDTLRSVLNLDRQRTMIDYNRSWKWYSKEPIADNVMDIFKNF